MIAIILAAGYATRLYPLTENTPKALLKLDTNTMLDHLMSGIITIPDIHEALIVTNDRFYQQFEDWRKAAETDNKYPHISLRVLNDGTTSDANKRGAVGDMQYVIEQAHVDDDLLVCASDNFFTFPLIDFFNDYKRTGCDTLLMTKIDSVETLRSFAVATLDSNRRVTGLVEKPKDPPSDIGVYALYLYRRDTVPMIKTYLSAGHSPDAPGHFPEWLYKRRDVRGYLFEGECIDIGTFDVLNATRKRFEVGGDLYNG